MAFKTFYLPIDKTKDEKGKKHCCFAHVSGQQFSLYFIKNIFLNHIKNRNNGQPCLFPCCLHNMVTIYSIGLSKKGSSPFSIIILNSDDLEVLLINTLIFRLK